MNAHKCRRRKRSAQLFHFRHAEEFQVQDGKRSSKPLDGGAGFLTRLGNYEIPKLITQRCSEALRGNCISVCENYIDRPHGKPLLEMAEGGRLVASPVMMCCGRLNDSAPARCGTYVNGRAAALFGSVTRLRCRFEGLGLKLAIALQQNLNFPFSLLQFLAAGTGKFHALVEELQRVVERNVTLLQFGNNLFQPLEALFKSGFGYALAANSCEGATGVDACTVTAS